MTSSDSAYGDITKLVIPDVLGGMYDYIAKFSKIQPDYIFIAAANNAVLPPSSNNFAIINLLSSIDYGTNGRTITTSDNDSDVLTTTSLKKITVQVDVYGNTIHGAMADMELLRSLWRDPIACDFFETLQISPLTVTAARHFTDPDSSDQFVERFSADFTLSAWQLVNMNIQTFDNVSLNGFSCLK